MQHLSQTLSEGNSRSLEKAVAAGLRDPSLFPAIIAGLHSNDPLIRRRTANVVERISRKRPIYLHPYKDLLIEHATNDKPEIRVKLLQLLPRLPLDAPERATLFERLRTALSDISDMLKAISLPTLVTLAENDPALRAQLLALLEEQIATGIPANQHLARYEHARLISAEAASQDQQRLLLSLHERWQRASHMWGWSNQFMRVAMNSSRAIRKQERERKRQAPPTRRMMVKELGNLVFYAACIIFVCIALAQVTFPLRFVLLSDYVSLAAGIFVGVFGIVMVILCVRNLLTMRTRMHQQQHASEREK